MRLNHEQRRILSALQQGCYLKIHRTLDGAKVYCLHCSSPEGENSVEELSAAPIAALERHGYIQSNMKFPAATLLAHRPRRPRTIVGAQGPAATTIATTAGLSTPDLVPSPPNTRRTPRRTLCPPAQYATYTPPDLVPARTHRAREPARQYNNYHNFHNN